MVQILPNVRKPSFSQSLGQALGAGVGSGISAASQLAQQMGVEKIKQNMRRNFIEEIERGGVPVQTGKSSYDELSRTFLDSLPQIEQRLGREITPQEADEVWKMLLGSQGSPMSPREEDPFRKARQYAALGERELADIAKEEGKMTAEERAQERKEERKRGQSLLEKRDASRESLLQRQADYRIAKEAIERNPKDIGSLKNYIAETFKLPQLKTAPGAAFSAAMKDAFIQSIRSVPGTRPNQWLEQQIQSALARIGQSDEANLAALEIGQFKLDLEEQENALIDQLEEEALSRGERLTGRDKKELFKRMKDKIEEKQFELAFKLKSLEERSLGVEKLKKTFEKSVPKGTPLTPTMGQILLEEAQGDEEKALKAAIKLGYQIPSDEFMVKQGYVQ